MIDDRSTTSLLIFAWIAAIGLSFLADRWVAETAVVHRVPQLLKRDVLTTDRTPAGGHRARFTLSVADILKVPGEYWVTGVLAVMAMLVSRPRPNWYAGIFVLLCGLLSGVNGLIKWITGRARPFKALDSKLEFPLDPFHLQPFYHGISGLFGTTNLCFPSGHAALAFANAAGIAILFPRWRWLAYSIAAICAAERFLETAHYFSDTVVAAALGIGGAHLLAWALSGGQDEETPRVQEEPATASHG